MSCGGCRGRKRVGWVGGGGGRQGVSDGVEEQGRSDEPHAGV